MKEEKQTAKKDKSEIETAQKIEQKTGRDSEYRNIKHKQKIESET